MGSVNGFEIYCQSHGSLYYSEENSPMFEIYGLIMSKIKRAEIVLAVSMFAFIVAIIAAQIFIRYIFGKPLTWAEELASLLLIYLTFLTADIVYREKGHISIDYFVNFLSPKAKAVVAIGVYLLIAVFMIYLIPFCITLLKMQSGHISTAVVTLPKSFWTLPVPIAFASMLLTTGYFISQEMATLRKL
jgi:TRAP-type C4-dicarboxylate transport system permease small subunit